MVGSIRRVGGERAAADAALALIRECIPGSLIGDWNDTHSHAEVLAAFDRAIAAAGEP